MAHGQKRQFDRIRISVEVAFVKDGARVVARSRDLSLGGMFVETLTPLPYGTMFSLEVRLPALATPAVIEATVRWAGSDGMGVQWGALRAKETWAINQLMRSA